MSHSRAVPPSKRTSLFPTPARRIAFAIASLLAVALAASAHAHLSIIRQGSESRGSIESNDHHGAAVVAGDFNGDGYDDLATGAPEEDLSGVGADAGAVIVSWGTPRGLTHVGATLLTLGALGQVDQAGARFGAALAAADFNGDGRADLVIGAPEENIGSVLDAGRFYVLRGSATGFVASAIAFDQTTGGGSLEGGDRMGSSFAVGNFNADANGLPDLAVGAPGEDQGAGTVFINYFGSPFGLTTGAVTFLKQSHLGGSNDAGDAFGAALAAANFVGTSAADLAIGAPNNGGELFAEIGAVYIVRGSTSGLGTASPILIDHLDTGASLQSGAHLGTALAAGQLFAGTYASLAIGEPNRTVGGHANAGAVYVVEGGASDFDYSHMVTLTKLTGPRTNDRYGSTLATGNWGNTSALDELMVGAPHDNTSAIDGGACFLYAGRDAGPHVVIFTPYVQNALGDGVEAGDLFGSAIAFGRFDDTNFGSFAVGAPGETVERPIYDPTTFFDEAGAVHVLAPWRQPTAPTAYTSIAGDCAGNLVFTQKPFEPVKIASTTKVMTLLIACERIQAHQVESTDTYTITPWIAPDNWISGTQAKPPLENGETLTLDGLLRYMIYNSGNDATYAAADLLEGGGGQTNFVTYVNNVTNFVADMNTRAAQIGMGSTVFTTPNGFDDPPGWLNTPGDAVSTAYDMWLLLRTAMQNPLARAIMSADEVQIARNDSTFTVKFGSKVKGQPKVLGGKGGDTDFAHITGVWAGYDPLYGRVEVGSFGNPSKILHRTDALNLINLGFGECGISPIVQQADVFKSILSGASTQLGSDMGAASDIPVDGDVYLDLFRQSGSGNTTARIELGRSSQSKIVPGDRAVFGVSPFHSHTGFVISNPSKTARRVQVLLSHGSGSGTYVIEPESLITIPPHAANATSFTMSVENLATGGAPIEIGVREQYVRDFTSIPAPSTAPFATWRLFRDAATSEDGCWSMVHGTAPTGGSTLYAVAREAMTTVDVELPRSVEEPRGADVTLLAPAPNPFRAQAEIAFELATPNRVTLAIHDVQGREMVRVDYGTLAAGRWSYTWDGSSHGRKLGAGMYFVRVAVGGRTAAARRLILTE